VLTHFKALGKDVSLPSKEMRRTKYIEFCFKGKQVCRETFLFLYTLSLKCYRNLLEHFCNNGLLLRDYGNYRKAPHNRMAFDDVHAIVEFLKNLATAHALPLPGRLPGHKDKALVLPSDMAKRSVYHLYVKLCSEDNRPHSKISFSLDGTCPPHLYNAACY